MIPRSYLELLVCLFDISRHAFHVVVYAVEHAALVNDHGLQFLEDVRQFDDALGYVFDFALALGDERFVGIMTQSLLFGLEEC